MNNTLLKVCFETCWRCQQDSGRISCCLYIKIFLLCTITFKFFLHCWQILISFRNFSAIQPVTYVKFLFWSIIIDHADIPLLTLQKIHILILSVHLAKHIFQIVKCFQVIFSQFVDGEWFDNRLIIKIGNNLQMTDLYFEHHNF